MTSDVFVIGKGHSSYRIYNLEELHQAGVRIWLFDNEPLDSAEKKLVYKYYSVDFEGNAAQQAASFAKEFEVPPVDFGICYIESLIPWSAEWFSHLGVKFLSPAEAQKVRSKYQMRAAFAHAGMRTPRYFRGTPSQLLDTELEFPVVVKPEYGYSSIGVELICDARELSVYFKRDNNVRSDTYIVEGQVTRAEHCTETNRNILA